MHPRALTATLASVTMALGGALAATTVPASAEDPVSPLKLRVRDQVVAQSYGGRIYSDLGLRLIARGEAFEIHAKRAADYEGEITATWKRDTGDVPLPAGTMSSWQGLDRFATVRVFRDGEQVRQIRASGCFNGRTRQIGPGSQDGPTVFPWGCPWNPYTLGSVMGVDEDHSTALLPEWSTSLRLQPGTYQMTAEIAPAWREFFGIPDAAGQVDTELVVEKAVDRWRSGATSARTGSDALEAAAEEPATESSGTMVNAFAPDLRSLPAFGINLNEKGTVLRFGATVWNGGAGPMVIEGFRRTRTTDHMTAYQYYFDASGDQTGYDEVGEFHYHAANHNHWHFADFARYNLYRADEAGDLVSADPVKSTKQSFCLVATDAVDLTVPNADMRPEYTDLGSQCGGEGALSLRQVLANGHGDTYHQYRAGQAFRVGNLLDGIYYIGVEANPADEPGAERDGRNLQELDYTNNDSFRKVQIFTTPKGVRKVRAFQVGDVEERQFGGFLFR